MRDLRQIEVLAQKGTACGTTCLAMIVRFLTHNNALTPDEIDRQIRRLPGMFSAPSDLITFARRKGLRAEEYNDNSLKQLEDLVTQGIPMMALLDLTPDNALDFSQWHWVVVVGMEEKDGQKTLVINNPWGRREEWPQSQFLKEWSHLRLLGLVFGYSNYLIAVGERHDKLPPARSAGAGPANVVTKGLADVLNGFARARTNKNVPSFGQMALGGLVLFFGVVCLIGYNIVYAARAVAKQLFG